MFSPATFSASLPIGVVGLLFFVAGLLLIWNLVLTRHSAVEKRVDRLIQGRPDDSAARALAAAEQAPLRALTLIGVGTLPMREEAELVRRLKIFGVPADRSIATFFMTRLTLGVLLAVVFAIVLSDYASMLPLPVGLAVLALLGGAAGWYLPLVAITMLASRRVAAVARGLPDAIELLVVSVEAGLALEDSLDRLVPELRRSQPALADELALTSADLKILPSREVALGRLAERVPAPSVKSVVTTLSQTLRYGTPLAQALRAVAAELRSDTLIRLEERANRLPALMTIPMIIFILPALFLVVAGPAVLQLIDVFGR